MNKLKVYFILDRNCWSLFLLYIKRFILCFFNVLIYIEWLLIMWLKGKKYKLNIEKVKERKKFRY